MMIRKVILRNSTSGLAQQVVRTVLLFLVVPLFIRELGPERYGVFSLLSVIGNLNGFVGLGLNTALTKYVAEQGKSAESDYDFVVTVLLQVAVLVPVSLALILSAHFVATSVLGVPGKYFVEAHMLFIALVIANDLIVIGQSLTGMLDALQRVDIKNYLQLLYNISYWIFILLALFISPSLASIGLAILLSAIPWFLLDCFFVSREYGKLDFSGLRPNSRRIAKKQMKYGAKVYAGGLIGFFYEPFSKILVSHFIGVMDVGFFDIALRLRGAVWGAVTQIFYPLFPLISQERDRNRVRLYVHDIEQKVFFVVFPLVAVVVLTLPTFVPFWIHQNSSIIALTAVFIISFHLVGSSTVVPNYQFLLAKDLPEKTIILQLSNAFFNSVVFLVAVPFIGYDAVILGNIAAIMSSFVLSLYYQHRYLNSLIFDSPWQLGKLVMIFCASLGTGYLATFELPSDLAKVLVSVVVVTIVSLALYRLLRVIEPEDVLRYAGQNSRLASVGVKILCRA